MGYRISTDTIPIDVYDRSGKKLIEGIKPVNPTNQALTSLKNYRNESKLH